MNILVGSRFGDTAVSAINFFLSVQKRIDFYSAISLRLSSFSLFCTPYAMVHHIWAFLTLLSRRFSSLNLRVNPQSLNLVMT